MRTEQWLGAWSLHGNVSYIYTWTASLYISFANIRESSWECITWYPWCLEMEPSYGKANPHTAQYMYSMKTTLLKWYKKFMARNLSPNCHMQLVSHNWEFKTIAQYVSGQCTLCCHCGWTSAGGYVFAHLGLYIHCVHIRSLVASVIAS